jgi:Na+/H+ antiporter NhaD/arsenite permease-like protein
MRGAVCMPDERLHITYMYTCSIISNIVNIVFRRAAQLQYMYIYVYMLYIYIYAVYICIYLWHIYVEAGERGRKRYEREERANIFVMLCCPLYIESVVSLSLSLCFAHRDVCYVVLPSLCILRALYRSLSVRETLRNVAPCQPTGRWGTLSAGMLLYYIIS